MIVAWQFIARNVPKKSIRPVGGVIRALEIVRGLEIKPGDRRIRSYRPHGTVPFLDTILAINCRATISRSLRDEVA
jgi:hypothetical protein